MRTFICNITCDSVGLATYDFWLVVGANLKPWRITKNEISDFSHSLLYTYDTSFELSVIWPSDTESRINELRLSYSVSLSFKTRLTSVTCCFFCFCCCCFFAATLRTVNFKHGTRDGKHDDVTS